MYTTSKERIGAVRPCYINNRLKSEVSIMLCCQLCPVSSTNQQLFAVLFVDSNTNQELFEKHLCNQNSHYEKYRRFPYEGKPSRATAKSTLFTVSKDEWDTKEDTGKSTKNALYVLRYAKRYLSGRSNIEQ